MTINTPERSKQEIVGSATDASNIPTCPSREPEPGSGEEMLGVVADELLCSRSDRSSLEVAFEQVSRPLSVVVEMDEPALSEAGRTELDMLCSMNGTPPKEKKGTVKQW